MARKKKGRAAKMAKKNQHVEEQEYSKMPHTFVINRGKLGKNANTLLHNFRKVMEPFTASNLKVLRQNNLKDFITHAAILNVTHMVAFSKTNKALYLKVSKLPKGPTLTFQVTNYLLSGEIAAAQRHPVSFHNMFLNSPLLFHTFPQSKEDAPFQIELVRTMLFGMFPEIDNEKAKLNSIRRLVALHYNEETEEIKFRHYAVKLVPVGLTRPVRKLIKKKVPSMSKFTTIEEYVEEGGGAATSESEAEMDGPDIPLPQPVTTRGAVQGEKVAPKLTELGPRLTLKLIKVEKDVLSGEVLYHRLFSKTEKEKNSLRKRHKDRMKLKVQRTREQEKNRREKLKAIENKKKKGKGDEEISHYDSGMEGSDDESDTGDESKLSTPKKMKRKMESDETSAKRLKFKSEKSETKKSPLQNKMPKSKKLRKDKLNDRNSDNKKHQNLNKFLIERRNKFLKKKKKDP